MTPIASVIIPVRNEEADIESCLRAVAAQDVGAGQLEVIVADGRSTDRTRKVIDDVAPGLRFGRFVCIDNPDGGISSGLNRALREARGPVILRVDARSRIEPHYASTVLELLTMRSEVGVVGGAQSPIDRGTGPVAAGIARALSNRLTTGLSRYRRTAVSGPSDTTWLGAFRADELRHVGGWNESLSINEDYELCERYRAGGRTVWFEGSLRSGYLPRPGLVPLAHQYFSFGRAKGGRWASGAPVAARHVVLVSTPPVLALSLGFLSRRIGWTSTVLVAAGAGLAAEHVGSGRAPAEVPVRAAALVATLMTSGAWWVGVVVGYAQAGGPR